MATEELASAAAFKPLRKMRAHARRRISKNQTVRVSREFIRLVAGRRRSRPWDVWLRIAFGLPDRWGRPQPSTEGMLETTTGIFIVKLHGTSWEELEQMVYRAAEQLARKKGLKNPCTPVRMQEIR